MVCCCFGYVLVKLVKDFGGFGLIYRPGMLFGMVFMLLLELHLSSFHNSLVLVEFLLCYCDGSFL